MSNEPSHEPITAPEVDLPEAAAAGCFVHGGPWFRRPTRAAVAAWSVIAIAFAIPLRGLFSVGGSMDEALMLVFPGRLLKGDLPNQDFLHLYGPGSLHVLAGWYRLFGASLFAERSFGVLQHLFTVTALFTLVRPFGRRIATYSTLLAILLVLLPTGPAALAWPGAVALGLWSLVFGLRALHVEGASRTRHLLAAGFLVGLALSYRPDLVLALALAWGFLWSRHRWSWKPLAAAAVGLTPMWVHLAQVGVPTAWRGMVSDPLFELRPGRNLPRPPSWHFIDGALQALNERPFPTPWWRLPALAASHQLFIWFFVVLIINIGTAIVCALWLRRDGATPRGVGLLTASLFGLGLTGQALQRPDSTHLAWGWVVSAALIPVLVAEWLRRRAARGRLGPAVAARRWLSVSAPAAVVVALMLVVCPFWTFRPYLAMSRVSAGNLPLGVEVTRGDRHFYLNGLDQQAAAQAAIDQLAASSQPGQRLFVGPADLRRTVYDDPFFYYLFPELTPSTYFIELDPGIANLAGSRLASDVESADWLVLTNFWTGWYEPNTSADYGSNVPNTVVADHFCLVGNYENALVLLYQRCDAGDGVEPWTLGMGPDRLRILEEQRARRSAEG
ncbi:MAG: hypothetical protein F2681_12960 [Actinobacteria bacterium]|uniref:Unannotated protein n=1 Tax=freshwater metagenome TaxID=449393 RepID=A0A6J7NNE7_9ZZZZ|nr:hypothetical protein [Actinomycetota bacterium]MSW78447.1 hypothetical protein [Actinomycetota bacterium]MSX92978.1 hypothetical protein [Actinomycetota bacterium]MSZ84041.1 hypothetical protein [Actinomycetota bacterium]MTB18768.1 hypothetical protein [Actinomycetota bacterium]